MKVGEIIRKWRLVNEISLRDLAKETGISPATLLRIEQGKPCDSGTFLRLMNWLFSEESK